MLVFRFFFYIIAIVEGLENTSVRVCLVQIKVGDIEAAGLV